MKIIKRLIGNKIKDILLKITNDGISYKNEKTAGRGIEIDSGNKINVKIDNDTIKIDSNNKLYANINEIVRYMQDSIAKYDKYDYSIIECFLEDYTEIAFPDYTYFNGLRAFPVIEIKNTVFRYIKFTGDFVMDNLEVANDYEFQNSQFNGIFSCDKVETIGIQAFRVSQFTGDFNCQNLQSIGYNAFLNSAFDGAFECPNLQEVGNSAFRYSQFTGSFNCPNLTSVGDNAFASSTFDTITIGANATLGTGCIGAHSAEFINDYEANGRLAGTYVWDGSHWIYQG